MKKLVLTLTASLVCVAAFAQGRISFQNDSLHLAYWVGGALDNKAVWNDPVNPQPSLMADLYVGTSSSTLSLITSTTFSGTSQGKWNSVSLTLPTGFPGGSQVFIVTQIRDAGGVAASALTAADIALGPLALAQARGYNYIGLTPEFTFVLGTSALTVPPMWNTGTLGGGGSSTWPRGTWPMDYVGVPGSVGSIAVFGVPEPTSFALAGLGAAAMLIFRRRK